MNKFERTILIGAYRQLAALRASPWPSWHTLHREPSAAQDAWLDAQKGVVLYSLEGYIGRRPSPSERTMAVRTLKALEAAGLIVRVLGPLADAADPKSRTKYLGITEAGVTAARGLLPAEELTAIDDHAKASTAARAEALRIGAEEAGRNGHKGPPRELLEPAKACLLTESAPSPALEPLAQPIEPGPKTGGGTLG